MAGKKYCRITPRPNGKTFTFQHTTMGGVSGRNNLVAPDRTVKLEKVNRPDDEEEDDVAEVAPAGNRKRKNAVKTAKSEEFYEFIKQQKRRWRQAHLDAKVENCQKSLNEANAAAHRNRTEVQEYEKQDRGGSSCFHGDHGNSRGVPKNCEPTVGDFMHDKTVYEVVKALLMIVLANSGGMYHLAPKLDGSNVGFYLNICYTLGTLTHSLMLASSMQEILDLCNSVRSFWLSENPATDLHEEEHDGAEVAPAAKRKKKNADKQDADKKDAEKKDADRAAKFKALYTSVKLLFGWAQAAGVGFPLSEVLNAGLRRYQEIESVFGLPIGESIMTFVENVHGYFNRPNVTSDASFSAWTADIAIIFDDIAQDPEGTAAKMLIQLYINTFLCVGEQTLDEPGASAEGALNTS